jgi:hypothetical protein
MALLFYTFCRLFVITRAEDQNESTDHLSTSVAWIASNGPNQTVLNSEPFRGLQRGIGVGAAWTDTSFRACSILSI